MVVAAVASAAALATPVVAAPDSRGEMRPRAGNVSSGIIPQSERAATLRYWTPERMAAAKPVDLTLPSAAAAGSQAPSLPASRRDQTDIPGVLGVECAPGVVSHPGPGDGTLDPVPPPYDHLPECTTGKAFFVIPGHGDSECSATAVVSANQSLVWTAGHCVHQGSFGGFYLNWMFVPAYGSTPKLALPLAEPYGRWVAEELFTTDEYARNSNDRQDLGAAVLDMVGGKTLVAVVGGQGMRFNSARDQVYDAFGYAGKNWEPTRFMRQWVCDQERYLGDSSPPGAGPPLMVIGCQVLPGMSGGCWCTEIATSGENMGLGFVTSVNKGADVGSTRGTYLGEEALGLYRAAEQ